MSDGVSEQYLDRLERNPDPASIPQLIALVREQQRSLDGLRLSLDVARRDREELRSALLAAQDEVGQLRARLDERHNQDGSD